MLLIIQHTCAGQILHSWGLLSPPHNAMLVGFLPAFVPHLSLWGVYVSRISVENKVYSSDRCFPTQRK